MHLYRLHVNGQSREATAEATTPLLYVLRNDLELNGPKFGCGLGQCGACMVLVDGVAMRSCQMPVSAVENKPVITLEGLGSRDSLHPLQKAFIEHFAFQCGYCTAGFLNESQVLLERLAKKPIARADLEKTIAEALDGHLCRCTGYSKYHEAVRAVILADPGRYLS